MLEPPVLRPAWRGNSNPVAASWMIASALCIALAALMRVGENRQVFLIGWTTPIPETCGMVQRLGIDCPGCGLTRCFIHMTHGRLLDAVTINSVGVAIFLFALLQIPFGFAQVALRFRNRWTESWGQWNDWIVAALLVALVLQWLVRMSLWALK